MTDLLRKILRPLYYLYIETTRFLLFKRELKKSKDKKLKIVVGSSGIFEKGWIPTEYHFLNLLKDEHWLKYFKPDSIDTIVAEHVWEHLSKSDGMIAATTCFKYLKGGGRLRVAVPDGFHPDPQYIEYVRPGGIGAGAHDHKVLYNHKTFSEIFLHAGFNVELLEYFDEDKKFQAKDWSNEHGYIHRSIRYDQRNAGGKTNYTSLIIDAIKPSN
ncbi:MAG TPA: hypothetical protein VF691_13230 [Cytophagaceae bacterium]|jgi:predicted SAM-dependent methyltransferase